MPSDRQTRRQRHQAAIKPQRGKAIRGAQATEFVKNSGYRKSEFIGGKKYYTPMSTDPKSSGAGGDVTNVTISGSSGINNAVLSDGTVPFSAKQLGVSPTESQHLATKGYVDDTSANTTWTLSDGTTTQPVIGGNTVTVVDGTAINAVVSATDTLTINNTGVASAVAGSGISVSAGTGDVTVSNTGVTSNVAGTGITVSGATGAVTIANSGVLSVIGGTSITSSGGQNPTISVTADSITDTQLAYNTGQHLTTGTAVTFASVNTGQGANELYEMNQNVLNTSDVTFNSLTTTADIIVGGDDITSDPFTSGFTGSGWKIDNTGHAEFSSASIRGTLSVYELLLQQLRATNGSVLITAVAKIESIDGSDITFEDPSDNGVCPFHTNDIVMVQRANLTGSSSGDNGGGSLNVIRRLVRRVTSVSGRTITVTRDGDLPADTGSFGVGDDVVRIGNTTNTNRDALLYLSADDSKAPYMVIKDGVNSWANFGSASTEKARLGRLDGITDTDAGLSGSQSNLYGLYSDSVYLKGHIYANSGSIGGVNMGSSKLYVGTGTYANANTGFYLDSGGDFSLKDKLTWDSSASTLTLKGTFILENGDSVGAGITWRGTYNAGVAYAKNDSVVYQSSSYIALQSTTGNTPSPGSSYWDLLADQGSDGANGSNGSNGQNGQDGTNGSNGQDGATGQTGAQGATGATGAQGATGAAGAAGAAGARGSRHYYYSVSGSSWSDSDANTAISNAGDTKVARDTVTLSKANTFSTTKYWDGDSWEAVTQVVDGNLIVHGTVGADQVDANDIFSVNITATNTITGGTLQTGSSGQRIVMDGSNNKMNFYNSSGTNLIQLDAGGSGYGAGMQIVSGGSISLSRDANAYPSNTTTTSHMSIYPNQLTVNTRSDYPASSGIYSAHIGDDNSTLRAGYFSCTNNSTGGNSRAYGLHVAEGMFVHDSAKWAWFGNHSREVGYGIDGGVLNVRGYTNSDPSAADGQAIRIWDAGSGVNRWSINIDSGDDLSFRYNATSDGGWISNTSNTGQITFTGQHRCKGNSGMTTADYAALEGYIVSASGSYDQMNGDDITISEALPVVALSSTDNDKKVFGVVSGREGEMRTYQAGQFNSSWGALSEEEERIMINSLGEGAMWVTNLNGNLENGDYVTSSTAAGLGQKQDDDLLHNYTVAKITQDCDFSSGTEFQHNGQTYKKQFVGCTYHCG